MAPKTPSKTTQTTEVKLPKWVENASESNYEFAKGIANKPYKAYTGQTVADTPQTTLDAYQFFKKNLGAGNDAIAGAEKLFNRAGGGILGMDREAYTNPFTDEVETNALRALNDQRVQALMGNQDKAVASKAFGGSRSAIVDAITNAEATKGAGDLSSKLRLEGFNNASGLMQSDLDRMLQSGQGLLATGGAEQTARDKGFAGLLGIGEQQQSQTQRKLDDAKGKWNDKENYDLERLNILLSSLGMSPYGKSESTVKTGQAGSSGTDVAQLGLGIFSVLAGLSDRTEKTDIKRVGTSKIKDIPLYAYRYKGDPKSYPKIVGPMAQDIEKAFPGVTGKTSGGKMTVPLGVLAQIAEG